MIFAMTRFFYVFLCSFFSFSLFAIDLQMYWETAIDKSMFTDDTIWINTTSNTVVTTLFDANTQKFSDGLYSFNIVSSGESTAYELNLSQGQYTCTLESEPLAALISPEVLPVRFFIDEREMMIADEQHDTWSFGGELDEDGNQIGRHMLRIAFDEFIAEDNFAGYSCLGHTLLNVRVSL